MPRHPDQSVSYPVEGGVKKLSASTRRERLQGEDLGKMATLPHVPCFRCGARGFCEHRKA